MRIGYLKNTAKSLWMNEIKLITEVGVSLDNIALEESGNNILHQTIARMQSGDTLVVISLSSLADSMKNLFRLLDYMLSRNILLESIQEPWMHTCLSEVPSASLRTLLTHLLEFDGHLTDRKTRQQCISNGKSIRGRGRPVGSIKPETRQNLDAAVKLYKENSELSVSKICALVHCEERTFYRYIKQTDQSAMRRRRSTKTGQTILPVIIPATK